MKNIKTYKLFLENYSDIKNMIDEILDKISLYGIDSLSLEEKNFLDSQKEGGKASEEAYSKLVSPKEINKKIESTDGRFTFILKHIETEDSESEDGILTHFHGIMKLPDMIMSDGKKIDGNLEGYLSMNEQGFIITNFEKNGYTDYDFVEGLEHEYDSFIYQDLLHEIQK